MSERSCSALWKVRRLASCCRSATSASPWAAASRDRNSGGPCCPILRACVLIMARCRGYIRCRRGRRLVRRGCALARRVIRLRAPLLQARRQWSHAAVTSLRARDCPPARVSASVCEQGFDVLGVPASGAEGGWLRRIGGRAGGLVSIWSARHTVRTAYTRTRNEPVGRGSISPRTHLRGFAATVMEPRQEPVGSMRVAQRC